MTIDPVAVYAAVVASGALGWQVYQWRFDRKGQLDVAVQASYANEEHATLMVTLYNSNDFPVKIGQFNFSTMPTDGSFREGVLSTSFNAHAAGIPTVVPAHDSVQFLWGQSALRTHLPGLPFRPNDRVIVDVTTSLHHRFSGSTLILDISDKLTEDMKKLFGQDGV